MQYVFLDDKYIVYWLPGKNFPKGIKFTPDNLEEHINYIIELAKEGKVTMAGPFADGTGAMTIFNNSDEKNIESIINNNPFVKNGMIKAKWVLWKPFNLEKLRESN